MGFPIDLLLGELVVVLGGGATSIQAGCVLMWLASWLIMRLLIVSIPIAIYIAPLTLGSLRIAIEMGIVCGSISICIAIASISSSSGSGLLRIGGTNAICAAGIEQLGFLVRWN